MSDEMSGPKLALTILLYPVLGLIVAGVLMLLAGGLESCGIDGRTSGDDYQEDYPDEERHPLR